MPHLIHVAMHPPRFIRGGIRLSPRRARRDALASFCYDEQQRIKDSRIARRDLEREAR
jgi:hypothetical protein